MAQDLATEFVADLYRRERTGIARSVARIAGESHAEDLVHDAFVAYLTKAPWADRPGAWVSTVARNRALNTLRRPKLVPLSGDEPTPAEIETPDAEREAVRTVVAEALSSINERSLVALRMKFFEGADYPAIAEALGVRVPQAHVIIHRSLRRLGRELIRRMADAHGAGDCAQALVRLAGLSTGEAYHDNGHDSAHDSGPCALCAPAWDEIQALRIGAWLAPLVAFKNQIKSFANNLAGRMTPRGSLASDAVSRTATAFVALGVAASSMAPAVASGPSVAQRPAAQVEAPAAGTSVQQAEAGTATAPGAKPVARAPMRPATASDRTTTAGTAGRVTPPSNEEPGHVSNDGVGGVLICTDVSKPCAPPPPGRAGR